MAKLNVSRYQFQLTANSARVSAHCERKKPKRSRRRALAKTTSAVSPTGHKLPLHAFAQEVGGRGAAGFEFRRGHPAR
jgi:hypothetical protein